MLSLRVQWNVVFIHDQRYPLAFLIGYVFFLNFASLLGPMPSFLISLFFLFFISQTLLHRLSYWMLIFFFILHIFLALASRPLKVLEALMPMFSANMDPILSPILCGYFFISSSTLYTFVTSPVEPFK